MKKTKILYIISNLTRCGPVNILYGIIRHIDKEKFEINILTLSKETEKSMLGDFSKLDVKIYNIDLSRIGMQLYGKTKLKKIVKHINPDIIHTHGIRADVYSSKYITSNIFTTIHNYPHKDYVMAYGNVLGKWMVKKQVQVINKITNPIACSESISIEMEKLFDCKMDYIKNGINIQKFKKVSNSQKKYVKDKLGIDFNKKIIISVGRLTDVKNPIKIIKSFIESKISGEYMLIMLGDGKLREECQKYSNENVLILGEVSNVNDYLNISDIFISASKSEGLPNAVLEAMAAQVMVILSDISPHKEIIEEETKSGILFNLEKNELVNILNNINKLDLESRGKKCREIVEKNFSDEVMSNKYQQKYMKVLKDGDLNE
jgi:glycosyltransferase involved in cell wall biosynthesis